MATTSEILTLAIEHHHAGWLIEAERLYRQVLQSEPDQPDALHLLGLIANQQGKYEAAVDLIGRAIRQQGTVADFHYNLGGAYFNLGRLPEAAACFQQALILNPDCALAYNNLGSTLKDMGDLDEAVNCYRRTLELMPDYSVAHNNLGNVLRELGRLDEAILRCRRAVELDPSFAEAHRNLGNILYDQRLFDEAIKCYHSALALNPNLATAHNSLGKTLKLRGSLDEAIACFRRALELNPGQGEFHRNLGQALKLHCSLDEAISCYCNALAIDPRDATTLISLGAALMAKGRVDMATTCFAEALALRPDDAEVHNSLGNAQNEQGNLDAAATSYRRAIEIDPNLAEAHYNLGIVLMSQKELDAAMACYEKAMELRPHFAEAHHNLGFIRAQQGDLNAAAAHYERALAINLDYVDAHNNLGVVLTERGDFAGAAACFKRALELNPDCIEAHYNRADMIKFRRDDANHVELEAIARDMDNLSSTKRKFIHFALAKALDDIGDYDRAFEHLLTGNALKRSEMNYDETGTRNAFRRIANLFSPDLFERFQGAGNPSFAPIFVLGMPRSGSTLVEQILASHPDVYGAGELIHLNVVAQSGPVAYPACIPDLDADVIRRWGDTYLAKLPPVPQGQTRITDKRPLNFLYAGLIRLILPNAKIVHTMRDPVDTCLSCYTKLFTFDIPFAYNMEELGRYYCYYNELMKHWRAVLPPGTMLDVAYEDVVDDLEGQARRLLNHCGLPWDDRCLEFHKTKRPVQTASVVQVRQPIYRSSVQRWRRYEQYLQPLLAELEIGLPWLKGAARSESLAAG